MMTTSQTNGGSGGEFTAEQKSYLEGFMSGIAKKGLFPFVGVTAGGRITDDPTQAGINLAAEETFHGTPLGDLCKEERWKYEENPVDCWNRMLDHAEKNQFPDPENTFRFKYHGLFYVAPAQNAFMLRCRVPGGILSSSQLHGLAEIAEDWGWGRMDITTRANIQIREIAPKNIIQVLSKLQDLGLTSRGAGADNIRNITGSPVSGIDSSELYDCRSLVRGLHYYILNQRDLFSLPRKFNVAFDGGGSVSVVADTNDIGFVAVEIKDGHGVDPGIYFRVQLAGITGIKQFAIDSGIIVEPNQCVAVAAAMARLFMENGDRTNRKKARLKFLIDKWGIPKFLEETEKKLTFPLRKLPLEKCERPRPSVPHGHIGVFKQRQKGLNYIGAAIPVGRILSKQAHRLADIAQNYGTGEVCLSVFQNMIFPNIPDTFVETVKRSLVRMGFHYEASSISGGLISCTGNVGCKFSSTDTKGQAVELARYLDKKVSLDQPINIHFTGCPHSCAQHYIGDIGLLGTKVDVGGTSVEGYHVVLGGGFDQNQAVAREIFKGVPFSDLPLMIEKILSVFLDRRKSGENFSTFTRRHEVGELQEMFSK